MDQTLREKLIQKGWVTNFNADTLVKVIERHYETTSQPTLMEIVALADEVEEDGLGQVDLVRRALQRWGRPAAKPQRPGRQEFPEAQEFHDLWDWMESEWRANNDGRDLPVEVYGEAVLAKFCRCCVKPATKEESWPDW